VGGGENKLCRVFAPQSGAKTRHAADFLIENNEASAGVEMGHGQSRDKSSGF